MPQQPTTPETAAPLPPWLQNDFFFHNLPEPHQQAIRDIIQPLYDRLVLQPNEPLERATGTSLVYLLWTELLKQAEIASTPFGDGPSDRLVRRMLMDDLFLILGPKSQIASLLVRLKQLRTEPDEPHFPFPIQEALIENSLDSADPSVGSPTGNPLQ